MDARYWKWLVVTVLTIMALQLVWVELGFAQDGYIARPCGFDMNDDGVITLDDGDDAYDAGEDCHVCDGVTTDPDGDGDTEDQVYVDCNSGSNTTNCGTPGSPCLTINYALNNTSTSTNTNNRSDGNGDGNEDIICVRATCREAAFTINKAGVNNKGPAGSGTDTYRAVTAGTFDGWNRRYPADPTMVIAWDTDNDGEYPPYDTDQSEPFILDGCATDGCTTGTRDGVTMGLVSNLELAHVTLRNYRREPTTCSGYALRWTGTGTFSYHYIHDVVLKDILRDVAVDCNGDGTLDGVQDGHRTVSFSLGSASVAKYISIENVHWTGTGGWPMRGYAGGGLQYLRVANITRDTPATRTSTNLPMKLWKILDPDFVDILIDGTADAQATEGVFFNKGVERGRVASSTFINTTKSVQVGLLDDDALGDVDDIEIDANVNYCTKALEKGIAVFQISSPLTNGAERDECDSQCDTTPNPSSSKACTGSGAGGNADCNCTDTPTYMTNLSVTNNYFDGTLCPNQLEAFLAYQNGQNCFNPGDAGYGPLLAANNTVKGWNPATTRSCAFMIGRNTPNNSNQDWDWRNVEGVVTLRNNYVAHGDGDCVISNWKRGGDAIEPVIGGDAYTGTDWSSNYNVFVGSNPYFNRGGTGYNGLSTWNSATGSDANSRTTTYPTTCTNTFEADGYHLASANTCSKDTGNNDVCPGHDIDGDTRPINSTCDRGADEYETAAVAGSVQLTESSRTVQEGDVTLTFSVTRTGGSDGAIGVDVDSLNGTATGGASCTTGVDYVTVNGSESWANGVTTTQTFDVTICGDSEVEEDETFTVALSNPTNGATIGGTSSALITITDDDVATDPPVISVLSPARASPCTTSPGTTATVSSFTVPAGDSNRILIAMVASKSDFNPVTPTDPVCDMSLGGASVLYGATPLSRLNSRVDNNGPTYSVCSAVFGLGDPSAGTADIVATFPGTNYERTVVVMLVESVNATTMALTAHNDDGATAVSPRILSTPTIVDSSLILDLLNIEGRVSGGNLTPRAGQNQVADISCGTLATNQHMAVSAKLAPVVWPETMGWTWTEGTPGSYAHIAVSLGPVVTPPTTTPPVTTTTTSTTNTTTTTTTSSTTTTTIATCGDNIKDVGEVCDGTDLDGETCLSQVPFSNGTLACDPDCNGFDISDCSVNRRGAVCLTRCQEQCETHDAPNCGGTCPGGYTCRSNGVICECQVQ